MVVKFQYILIPLFSILSSVFFPSQNESRLDAYSTGRNRRPPGIAATLRHTNDMNRFYLPLVKVPIRGGFTDIGAQIKYRHSCNGGRGVQRLAFDLENNPNIERRLARLLSRCYTFTRSWRGSGSSRLGASSCCCCCCGRYLITKHI